MALHPLRGSAEPRPAQLCKSRAAALLHGEEREALQALLLSGILVKGSKGSTSWYKLYDTFSCVLFKKPTAW